MPTKVALACALLFFLVTSVQAQATIRVLRKDNGKPIANATVRIEAHPSREAIGKPGKTNVNGVFVTDKIPGGVTKIYIHIHPAEQDLQAITEIHGTDPKDTIVIRVPREIP